MLIRRLKYLFSKVPVELIKALRAKTSSPYNDIRIALEEAQLNIQEAQQILRKKGLAGSSKKADKATKHGVVSVAVVPDRRKFALLQVACQTDFVAKSQFFLDFVESLNRHLINQGNFDCSGEFDKQLALIPTDLFGGKNFLQAKQLAISKVQQNIVINKINKVQSDTLHYGAYVHNAYRDSIGLKAAVVGVKFSQEHSLQTISEVTDTLAVQVLGSPPKYLTAEKVPQQKMAQWRKLAKQQLQKRKANFVPSELMIENKVKKSYLEEQVLEFMKLIADPEGKTNVAQYLASKKVQAQLQHFILSEII